MIWHDRLENGIRVVSERMEHYRSVSLGIWVDAGSICERAEESGVSHFIEHMLFKGTATRAASDIASEMDAVGGNLNAFTAKECTCFYAKVLDEHIALAADMLSDILLQSKLSPEDIEREKGVVVEEIRMTQDSPEDVVHETLCTLIYEGTPLEKPILGTQESVRSFSRDTLAGYMDRLYRVDDIVIACAGSFEREALLSLLNGRFAAAKTGGGRERKAGVFGAGRRIRCFEKDVEQTHLCFGLPGLAADDERRYAMLVLNNALGGSMSSRLFQKIREEKGLAYTIYSYPTSYADTGYFALYAGTGADAAAEVARLVLDELALIRREGFTKEEFRRAKDQLRGNYLLGQENTGSRSSAIGKAELLLGEVVEEEELLSRLERVSEEDVAAIIPVVLDEEKLCASVVGKLGKESREIETMVKG
ncbi:MAG TPA: pitrilysin family protein [Clostridia bacterium]|nr:pitrilysin family protein [Clostridia bacterium]